MTVRLPDFSTSFQWNKLREEMEANETYIMPAIPISEITIKEFKKLQTGSISIENILDHINPLDNTFDYKGQKVLLYIKQQRYYMRDFTVPNYKFHIAYCSTLDWMENINRFKSRYVVTQRVDGQFEIDIINKETGLYQKENALYTLDVCKNCLMLLRTHYPNDKIFQFWNFKIDTFIAKYNTKHIKKPTYTPKTMPRDEYTSDWKEISKKMREQARYVCSACKHNFSKKKNMLHVHHIDGVKWNNKAENLQVLCTNCHRQEPGHMHLYSKAG